MARRDSPKPRTKPAALRCYTVPIVNMARLGCALLLSALLCGTALGARELPLSKVLRAVDLDAPSPRATVITPDPSYEPLMRYEPFTAPVVLLYPRADAGVLCFVLET